MNVSDVGDPAPAGGNVTSSPPDAAAAEYAAAVYAAAEGVFVWVFPFILLGGLAGNTLSLLVVLRPEQRRSSSVSVFMAALAITDSLVLVLDALNNWLKMVPKVYLLGSLGFCKFHRWLFDVSYTTAAWLVAGLGIERFIAVWFPFQARSICRPRYALLGVVLLPAGLALLYLYELWAWALDDQGSCNIGPGRLQRFMGTAHPWLTGTLYSYAPLIVLILCTSGILVQLVRMRRRRASMTTGGGDKSGAGGSSQAAAAELKEYRVARTVVAVCVAFLLLTVPLTLYYGIAFNIGQFVYQGPEMALIETAVLILGLSNHAINFWLYVATSHRFRVSTVNMIAGWCGVDDDRAAAGSSTAGGGASSRTTRTAAPRHSETAEAASNYKVNDEHGSGKFRGVALGVAVISSSVEEGATAEKTAEAAENGTE